MLQHPYIVHASLQLVPIADTAKHPYLWVDEVIAIIAQSSLSYEVGAFSTIVEGNYTNVMQLVHSINNYLVENKCQEWILQMQLQMRSQADMCSDEKTSKYKL